MVENVDIKVRTVVDSSDLEGLNKKLSEYSGQVEVGVDADTKSATDKLREVQKKAKELAAEKSLVNIKVATDGLQEIKKLESKLDGLRNMSATSVNLNVNESEAIAQIVEVQKKVNDLDGLSPQIKAMVESGAIDELQAIQRAADNLDGLSPKIKPVVENSEGLGGLESGITGILGTVGANQLLSTGVETATNMDKAWRNWVGSLQQSGMGLDVAKKKADGFYKTVNKLASEGQSSDSLFKNVAGLVINLNNQVSDSTLGMTEKVIAGYEMLGGRTGATMYEMEKELKNFLSTGDLGLMEDTMSSLRDPAKWKGLLEGADTVDERIQVLNDMLAEEGIMGALNIDAPSKSIDQLKALFDASMTNIGTTLINIIKPIADGFMWLDEVTGGVSTTILSVTAVVGLLGVGLIGLAGALGSVLPGLGNLTTSMGRFVGLAGKVPSMPGGPGGAGGGGGFLGWFTKMNTFAAEAAASTGPAALSWTTLSAGIQAMLAPMLMVAGVVAIMIPIVAGLAIEVLLFVRLIGEVVKALDFKSLKLDADISGIQSITNAMLNISAAMLAITAVNIVGIIHAATGGIITFVASLTIFVAEIKTAVPIINELASISNIDPSIANKIKQFNEACQQVVTAVKALGSIDSSLFNLNPFTNFVNSLQTAREDIGRASEILNGFTSLSNINPAAAEKIKTVTESLKHVADAISALRTVDDKQQTWNPMTNLIEAMNSARYDIGRASEILGGYSTLANVPSGTADKIKTVASSLKNVSDAITSMRKIDDEQQTWNPLTNLITAMESARYDIGRASIILAGYSTLANIPEGAAEKIQRVQWTLSHVKNALQSLSNLNDNVGDFNLDNLIGMLQRSRTNIGLASVSLASYATISNIPDGIAEKIQRVQWTLSHVKNAVTAINSVPAPTESNNVALAVTQIKNAHTELQKLANLSGDGAGITAAVTAVTNTINQIKNILSAASGVQPAAQNMGSKITTGFKAGAKNLTPAVITVLTSAINAVKNRYDTMRSAGNALGAALAAGFKSGAGINSPMAIVVSGMNETLKYITGLSDNFYAAGEALGNAIQDSYRAQHKSTTVAGYSNLINEVRSDVVNLFNGSGIDWMGGGVTSAAGGDILSAAGGDSFDIEYPSSKPPNITINSTVVTQDQIDQIGEIMERYQAQENLRVRL